MANGARESILMAGGVDGVFMEKNAMQRSILVPLTCFIVFTAGEMAGCFKESNPFAIKQGDSSDHIVGSSGAGGVQADLNDGSIADTSGGATGEGGSGDTVTNLETAGAGGESAAGAGDGKAGANGNNAAAGENAHPADTPAAGNPDGKCEIPADARAEDTSNPTHVVGTGVPQSCTSNAFVEAVAKGGIITFNCGPDPVTIELDRTAKIFNDKGPKIVIDGGGKVTLSGRNKVRILYQNACDQDQVWTTSHCDDQDHPLLTIQNLTFVNGNAKGEADGLDGGGAIFARGGRLKVINSRFFNNICDDEGPDVGGAAIRAFDQFNDLPAYVVNSTFGGKEGLGNVCSNGGGLSSIEVSYTVINSLFSYNKAIGHGSKPAKSGTPGGGNGGAIYNDGDTYTLTLCGTKINNNTANENGGAIFFVSNDRTGTLVIKDSILANNPSGSYQTESYPGVFVQAKGNPEVTNATIK